MSPSNPTDSDTSDTEPTTSLFTEPTDFYAAEKPPTFIDFPLTLPTSSSSTPPKDPLTLHLRLVGHNPLWAHHLWNSGRVLATHFLTHPTIVHQKTVLELGAGAGLPGLVAGYLGARRVVITDYPDEELVENLRWNVKECGELLKGDVVAEGYLWGAPPSPLMSETTTTTTAGGFDLLILGDLLFNHSEHAKLLESIRLNLRKPGQGNCGGGGGADAEGVVDDDDPKALVYFTPYRPWLLEKDLAFFELAREAGFRVEKVSETVLPEVMFKEDRGDELLRRTVFGYEVRWP